MSRPSWRSTVTLVITGGCAGLLALSPWVQMPPRAAAQAVATATATALPLARPSALSGVPSGLWGVIGAAVGAAIVGVVNWHGQSRQAEQLRETLAHQERQLKETHQHQAEQDILKDARSLRDRRYDRESTAYEDLVFAAWSIVSVVQEQLFLREGETEEQRDQRLGVLLDEALPKTRQAMIRLTLDEEVRAIRDLYDQFWRAFRGYQVVTGQLRRLGKQVEGLPATPRISALEDQQEKRRQDLEALVGRLEQAARERLDHLRRPLPNPPDGTGGETR